MNSLDNVHFAQMNSSSRAFKPNSFDLVISSVLHHTSDPYRHLNPLVD